MPRRKCDPTATVAQQRHCAAVVTDPFSHRDQAAGKNPHARTPTHLRKLPQAVAAGLDRGAHLHLRVHVLRALRRGPARQRLPELRRRLHAAPDPPGAALEGQQLSRRRSGEHDDPAPPGRSRRARRLRGGDQNPPARAAVARGANGCHGLHRKASHRVRPRLDPRSSPTELSWNGPAPAKPRACAGESPARASAPSRRAGGSWPARGRRRARASSRSGWADQRAPWTRQRRTIG